VSRRDQITLTHDEIAAFLDEQRVVICATNGPRGFPHLMPLWYAVRDGNIWAWTYEKSQKVRNLERDPRTTLQVESGEQYHELKGVMIEAATTIHRDADVKAEFGAELFNRYSGGALGPEGLEVVRRQAAKRVALEFVTERIASWDHSKLGGIY
jgi:PPOX class probable F420-dependent enzyme